MAGTPQLEPPHFTPQVRRWLPLILGLALGLRLALGWLHPFRFPDWTDYDTLARAIATHHPYETGGNVATRMPGYPVFVALLYALAGPGAERTVVIVQAFMGLAVVLLTYIIGRRVNPAVGLCAAALVAVDPLSVAFSAALLSETPFTLCLMASVWLCVRIRELTAQRTTALGHWLALGGLWALAVYFRAAALWAIVPLAAWTAWPDLKLTAWWRAFAPILAISLVFLLLTPWLVRNYRLFHSGLLRLTTLEGISLYEAVYPSADGGPKQDQIALPPDMQNLNEAQRNDEWWQRGWHYVRTDPLRIAKLALIKIGRTWSPWLNATEFRSGALKWGLGLWYMPLFAAACLGFLRAFTNGQRWLLGLCVIPVAYFTALHALFLGSVRYRVPLMPLVCLWAAAGINLALNRWGTRQRLVG